MTLDALKFALPRRRIAPVVPVSHRSYVSVAVRIHYICFSFIWKYDLFPLSWPRNLNYLIGPISYFSPIVCCHRTRNGVQLQYFFTIINYFFLCCFVRRGIFNPTISNNFAYTNYLRTNLVDTFLKSFCGNTSFLISLAALNVSYLARRMICMYFRRDVIL